MAARAKQKRLIEADKLSLNEWLALIAVPEARRDYLIQDYEFPTLQMRQEYMDTVHDRTDAQIKNLLRLFLIPTGSLGSDSRIVEHWTQTGYIAEAVKEFEFARRMLRGKPWEGNTWILDLLPHDGRLAIAAIDAYLTAHIPFIPDGRFGGLNDAMVVIRAKYLLREHPRDVLLSLTPRDFEYLVAELYRHMGYKIKITRATADGGLDIHAQRDKKGKAEKLLIQCKRYTGNVGVRACRELIGVVAVTNATKGVLVAPSGYTRSAREFEKGTRQLDLVSYTDLDLLLNEQFGAEWPRFVDHHITWVKRLEVDATGGFLESAKGED